MNEMVKIELYVEAETAEALQDDRRREAVSRFVDRMVQPTADQNPLAEALRATARAAGEHGLTEQGGMAELAQHKREQRAR